MEIPDPKVPNSLQGVDVVLHAKFHPWGFNGLAANTNITEKNIDTFAFLYRCVPLCRVVLEVDHSTGSTYLLEANRATRSTHLWAYISCVHCTSVCHYHPVIWRWINSLTLLSTYFLSNTHSRKSHARLVQQQLRFSSWKRRLKKKYKNRINRGKNVIDLYLSHFSTLWWGHQLLFH